MLSKARPRMNRNRKERRGAGHGSEAMNDSHVFVKPSAKSLSPSHLVPTPKPHYVYIHSPLGTVLLPGNEIFRE